MAFTASFHLTIFMILAAICRVCVFAHNDPPIPKFPLGDPRNCPIEKGVYRFEVLPGGGWDNLNNEDMGVVFEKNYSKCKLSDDGKFLLPDNVFLYPVKNSKVETFANLYDHWTNYSSLTAETINAQASVEFFGLDLGISGSYSSELRSVKEYQINENSFTTRVQIRHNLYKAKLKPDSTLDSAFKSRLLSIASHLQHNNTDYTKYLAQLLIRDFGTHYISNVNAGAILAKLDHLQKKCVEDFEGEKSNITAAASASFFASFLSFDGKFKYSDITEKKYADKYRSNTVFSTMFSIGGPLFRLNFSISQWEEQLPNELVAVDRAGDPLHFAITSGSLPELSELLVNNLRDTVQKAINEYFKRNTIIGCTKLDAPNFSFQANVDDGFQCINPTNNYTFGGLYQTCVCYSGCGEYSRPTEQIMCEDFYQTNPLTGNFNCPSGFDAVLVFQGFIPGTYTTFADCSKCSVNQEFDCCFKDYRPDQPYVWAGYSAYWCAASGTVPPNKGYLFGGLYSWSSVNPVTQTRSCPAKFYPLTFGAQMTVCVSDDYELGFQHSVPFGGFFSCQYGNPLAAGQSELGEFVKKPGPPESPKSCPAGYAQHLGSTEDECEIHFCVESNAFNSHGFPALKRPPYFPKAPEIHNYSIPLMLINQDSGQVWFKPSYSPQWLLATESSIAEYQAQIKPRSTKRGGLGKGSVAGIVVAVLVIGIVSVSAIAWRRYKGFNLCRKKKESLTRSLDNGRGYDSIGSDDLEERV